MKTTMNHCDEILALFSLHLDQELDRAGHSRLQRHLTACPDCKRTCEQMQVVDTLFRQAPLKYAPLGFTERAVAAAFDAELRRNLQIGLLALGVGTLVISSLALLGRADLVWTTLSLLLNPAFWSSSETWLVEAGQALLLAGRVGLTVLDILRDLLIGPLLLPSLISLLSGAFVFLFVQRSGQSPLRLPS